MGQEIEKLSGNSRGADVEGQRVMSVPRVAGLDIYYSRPPPVTGPRLGRPDQRGYCGFPAAVAQRFGQFLYDVEIYGEVAQMVALPQPP